MIYMELPYWAAIIILIIIILMIFLLMFDLVMSNFFVNLIHKKYNLKIVEKEKHNESDND